MARVVFYCTDSVEGEAVRELLVVRLARSINPMAGIIWFAAENYALDSFAIHIAYFGLLPVTRKKLELGLEACFLQQNRPPTL